MTTSDRKMISVVLVILTSFIAPTFQFIVHKHGSSISVTRMLMSSTAIFPTKDLDVLTIRVATGDELPRCAGFLSTSMYPNTVPKGQIRELQRLELADLRSRYGGPAASRQQSPAVFFVAVEEEEIIGSVGLDCQYFDKEKLKFRQIKSNKAVDPNREIIVVLSNLAVRRDRRKQKVAQKLLAACENFIKDNENWNFDSIYLQVDSENKIAQKLYIKQNYKLIFEDPDSTCVASGDFNLQTLDCTNYCFKKTISSSSGSGGNPFEAISGFFGSVFKK